MIGALTANKNFKEKERRCEQQQSVKAIQPSRDSAANENAEFAKIGGQIQGAHRFAKFHLARKAPTESLDTQREVVKMIDQSVRIGDALKAANEGDEEVALNLLEELASDHGETQNDLEIVLEIFGLNEPFMAGLEKDARFQEAREKLKESAYGRMEAGGYSGEGDGEEGGEKGGGEEGRKSKKAKGGKGKKQKGQKKGTTTVRDRRTLSLMFRMFKQFGLEVATKYFLPLDEKSDRRHKWEVLRRALNASENSPECLRRRLNMIRVGRVRAKDRIGIKSDPFQQKDLLVIGGWEMGRDVQVPLSGEQGTIVVRDESIDEASLDDVGYLDELGYFMRHENRKPKNKSKKDKEKDSAYKGSAPSSEGAGGNGSNSGDVGGEDGVVSGSGMTTRGKRARGEGSGRREGEPASKKQKYGRSSEGGQVEEIDLAMSGGGESQLDEAGDDRNGTGAAAEVSHADLQSNKEQGISENGATAGSNGDGIRNGPRATTAGGRQKGARDVEKSKIPSIAELEDDFERGKRQLVAAVLEMEYQLENDVKVDIEDKARGKSFFGVQKYWFNGMSKAVPRSASNPDGAYMDVTQAEMKEMMEKGQAFGIPIAIRNAEPKPVKIEEAVEVIKEFGGRIELQDPTKQGPVEEDARVFLKRVLNELKDPDHWRQHRPQNALNLRPLWPVHELDCLRLNIRLRLLDFIAKRISGGIGKAEGGSLNSEMLSFLLLSTSLTFSGPHMDIWNGTLVKCYGEKLWMFVAVDKMTDEDWAQFRRDGPAWKPRKGLIVVIMLKRGDVVLMPAGARIIHAPASLRPCLMEGSMIWDHREVLLTLENVRELSRVPHMTNEPVPAALGSILETLQRMIQEQDCLNKFGVPRERIADFRQKFASVKKEMEKQLACTCKSRGKGARCGPDCRCHIRGSRCTDLCANHTSTELACTGEGRLVQRKAGENGDANPNNSVNPRDTPRSEEPPSLGNVGEDDD